MSSPRLLSMATLVAMVAVVLVPVPAHAASMCVEDAIGDVLDQASKQTVSNPAIDITAMCIDHKADRVEITVRTKQPSDPSMDPAWANKALVVGAALSTNGTDQPDYDLNYVREANGQVTANVYRHSDSRAMCPAQASFSGGRYVARVPRDCLGNPATIKGAVYMLAGVDIANQAGTGQWDDVPNNNSLLGPLTTAPDYIPGTAARLSGPSRIHTAISISQSQFANKSAGAVVIARQDNYPDALAAASLARAKSAPVLLTYQDSLADEVKHELQRTLATSGIVYVTGGRAAISDMVIHQIQQMGYAVRRVSGPSRDETAVAIANETMPAPQVVVVADGQTFADALIAGSLASHLHGVQLLSSSSRLHPAAMAWLHAHPSVRAIAVGPAAAQALGARANTVYNGGSPANTSVLIARAEYHNPPAIALANAYNYPDGLAGGANSAAIGAPLLLTAPDVLTPSVLQYVRETPSVHAVRAYGGTAALSNAVLVAAGNEA